MITPQTFEEFRNYCCDQCNANDWYCPDLCDWLEKANASPLDKLQEIFGECDGDVALIAGKIDEWSVK